MTALINNKGTVDPGVTDDSGSDYGIGSTWVNTSTGDNFVCSDNTPGAAVWEQMNGGSAAAINITDDTSTNSDWYPTFSDISTGTLATAYVSSSQMTYNPFSGEMTSIDFISTSDERLKENIVPITDGVGMVSLLAGKSFNWKDSGKLTFGFIAQDVEKVHPALVNTNDEGLKSVHYLGVIGMLTEAIKELTTRIEELENK